MRTIDLFRKLSNDEVGNFKQWARENYRAFSEISPLWHPVVKFECCRINEEQAIIELKELNQ